MSEDSEKHYSSATHKRVQRSTTLNRKYVRRPAGRLDITPAPQKVKKSKKILVERPASVRPATPATSSASTGPWAAMAESPSAVKQKDEAIKRAMRSVATMESQDKKSRREYSRARKSRHIKRMVAAVVCAIIVIGAVGYLVMSSAPDISVRVAAIQSGISNPYPAYVPRGFDLITSSADESSVQMIFGDSEGHKFALSEEKTSWDSRALVSNYVEKKWSNYETVKEQDLTIYIWASSAAWVNNGVKYTIEADSGTLTNKQIKSIATSL